MMANKIIISIRSLFKNRLAKYWQPTGLILIFLSFFILRLYHLGFHDFWYDEIGTVGYAQYPWSNWNAPLYWILLHFWIKLFGISEISLRFPSLIFSFLSVILVFVLGKRLFNKKVGLFASIIMGLSPFHLWYAQEARDYSMVLFLGLFSSWLLFKAINEKRLRMWIFFTLASIAGLYTNYFFIFLLIAQFVYIVTFFKQLKLRLRNIIPFLAIAFGFLPYLSRFLSKFFSVWQGFWVPQPKFNSLFITIENFMLGYNTDTPFYICAGILAAVFLAAGIMKLKDSQLRPAIMFCLFLFEIPIILAFLFSRIFFSVYLDRGLIIASPYFYLILSFGMVSLNRRHIRIGSTVILCSLICVSLYGYYRDWMFTSSFYHTGVHLKKPIRPIVKFIEDNLEKGDKVFFTNQSVMPSYRYYSKSERLFDFLFVPGKAFDTFTGRPIYEGRYGVSVHKLINLEFDRLWVISCNWPRDGKLDENSQIVKEWLDKYFKLGYANVYDGLWIFRYVRL